MVFRSGKGLDYFDMTVAIEACEEVMRKTGRNQVTNSMVSSARELKQRGGCVGTFQVTVKRSCCGEWEQMEVLDKNCQALLWVNLR